ncbi:hypothetical protein HRbin01_01056 [archaeon HR01]|nr:hypothetical protein HRbin01_01056 [archaeon HR01]
MFKKDKGANRFYGDLNMKRINTIQKVVIDLTLGRNIVREGVVHKA